MSLDEKVTLRNRLTELANAMITDRKQADITALMNIIAPNGATVAYDDLSAANKIFLRTPQKGAYNYQDRNRVSEFCNKLVTLMDNYYGVQTPNYEALSENWAGIQDPTQAQLSTYTSSVIAIRNFWYPYLEIPGSQPSIQTIYQGISLATANNIEKVLKTINQYLNDKIFSVDPWYCGQYAANNSIVWSGINFYKGAL